LQEDGKKANPDNLNLKMDYYVNDLFPEKNIICYREDTLGRELNLQVEYVLLIMTLMSVSYTLSSTR
jgi:hypothetical protein